MPTHLRAPDLQVALNPALLVHAKTKLASKLQIKAGSASVPPTAAVPAAEDLELPANWI